MSNKLATPLHCALAFGRSAIALGYVSQGVASPAQPVFVTNTGDAALVISDVTLTGTQSDDFTLAVPVVRRFPSVRASAAASTW